MNTASAEGQLQLRVINHQAYHDVVPDLLCGCPDTLSLPAFAVDEVPTLYAPVCTI